MILLFLLSHCECLPDRERALLWGRYLYKWIRFEFFLRKYKNCLISQSSKNKSLRSWVLNLSTDKCQQINLLSIWGYVGLLHQLVMDVYARPPAYTQYMAQNASVCTFYLSTELKAGRPGINYILVKLTFFSFSLTDDPSP